MENQVEVTMRHGDLTPSLREYAAEKVKSIHLEYPKIISAKVILDVQKYIQGCEILLACSNHIHIEAETSSRDMYESIDMSIAKITRRMRKYKTRLLKKNQRGETSIKYLNEKIFSAPDTEEEIESFAQVSPILEEESFEMRKLMQEEAILSLELSDRSFIAYENAENAGIEIIYRKEGNYALVKLS